MLPCSYVLDFGFTKCAALCQLADGSLRDRGIASLLHDVGKNLVEESEYVLVDLLELEQEGVVAFRTVDFPEPRITDMLCNLLLLGKCEKAVALNA